MNETELRTLLADRAGGVVGDPERYAGVRRRIAVRRRARLAGVAAASTLLVLGSALAIPALRGGRPVDVPVDVTSSPPDWPRRGSDSIEDSLLETMLDQWSGPDHRARLLYFGEALSGADEVGIVVIAGRDDADRPVAAILALESRQPENSFRMPVGEVPLRKDLLLVGMVAETVGGHRYLVVLAAPGADEVVAIVGGERRSLGRPRDGLAYLENLPDGPVRVELHDGGLVVATEDPVVVAE